MLSGLLILTGSAVAAYVVFRAYFTWCYFEPNAPEMYPDNKAIRFEAILCTLLFVLHIGLSPTHGDTLSPALFWICAGSAIGAGVFPPAPNLDPNHSHGLFERIIRGVWKSKISGFIISTMILVYLTLFGWALLPGLSQAETLLVGGLGLALLVSLFKAGAAGYHQATINEVLSNGSPNWSLKRLLLIGAFGHISVAALLLLSPAKTVPDAGEYSDLAMVISVFIGAVLKI